MQAFFEMGGYAGFVWPAFALTAGVMVYFAVTSLQRLKARQRELEALGGARRRPRGEGPGGDE